MTGSSSLGQRAGVKGEDVKGSKLLYNKFIKVFLEV